jgi:hypothetical protein
MSVQKGAAASQNATWPRATGDPDWLTVAVRVATVPCAMLVVGVPLDVIARAVVDGC